MCSEHQLAMVERDVTERQLLEAGRAVGDVTVKREDVRSLRQFVAEHMDAQKGAPASGGADARYVFCASALPELLGETRLDGPLGRSATFLPPHNHKKLLALGPAGSGELHAPPCARGLAARRPPPHSSWRMPCHLSHLAT